MSKKAVPQSTTNQIKRDIIFGVGYGQPPRHSQFKKGQSGNPKGRPRKAKETFIPAGLVDGSNAAILSRVLNEPVIVSKNGRRRKITKAEAIQHNQEKLAFAGSILATRDLQRQLEGEDARRARVIEEDHARWDDYLVRRASDIAKAEARGHPPSRFWIEPEDILFRRGKLVEVRGPLKQEEVKVFEIFAKFIQVLMIEDFGRRLFGRQSAEQDNLESLALITITQFLPKRLERECLTFLDNLYDDPCFLWGPFERQRIATWQRLNWKMPKSFLAPITQSFSPAALQNLKEITASTRELMAARAAFSGKPRRYRARKPELT
jgi:hypothetical protein